ncbi:MAG: hypothetical protein VB013_05705 [Anaerolineaceae bacterium]|nr:hypothetical protein [Anaerolineaceae bacterium]
METNSNPDRLIAQTLAAPFTPRSQGNPLSFKPLHDGGMVVVISDGRKLWFSAAEVQAARRQVRAERQQESEAQQVVRAAVPVKIALAKPQQRPTDPKKKSAA